MLNYKLLVFWLDETARKHEEIFEHLRCKVIQHEVDHLNGVLFVHHVKDPKTDVTFSEYKNICASERKAQQNT